MVSRLPFLVRVVSSLSFASDASYLHIYIIIQINVSLFVCLREFMAEYRSGSLGFPGLWLRMPATTSTIISRVFNDEGTTSYVNANP